MNASNARRGSGIVTWRDFGGSAAIGHCDLLVGDGVGARLLRINGKLILHPGIGDAVMCFHLVDRTQRLRDSVTELELRNDRRRRHVVRAQHKDVQRGLLPDDDPRRIDRRAHDGLRHNGLLRPRSRHQERQRDEMRSVASHRRGSADWPGAAA